MAQIKSEKRAFEDASQMTSHDLKTIARKDLSDLTPLTLHEMEAMVDVIGNLLPAGNIPGIILRGLNHITGRSPSNDNVQRDIQALFQGVERTLDAVVYTTLFAGPAAVIWGYQNLLRLAGKNPDDAFPEGTWQFYIEYALREDTARHANETHGFDTFLYQQRLDLSLVDRMTAWTMAVIHALHYFDALLENEWRERVYIKALSDILAADPASPRLEDLYKVWERQRPYGYFTDQPDGSVYPTYRADRFDEFLFAVTNDLPSHIIGEWAEVIRAATDHDLPAYKRQMSILSYLKPAVYNEVRVPLPKERLYVTLYHEGHYYMIPACIKGTRKPNTLENVRQMIAALVAYPANSAPTSLRQWVTIQRATHPVLRERLNPDVVREMDIMRLSPILLNFDQRSPERSISEIRAGERGTGDQLMTIFDTGKTFVFDQSHIFFDGAWGAAFAEILTNEAINWASCVKRQPLARVGEKRPYTPQLIFSAQDWREMQKLPRATQEASAESDFVDLQRMLQLRRMFKARSDLINVTVNDLLIIYRAIHALTYVPHPMLIEAIRGLEHNSVTHKLVPQLLIAISEHGEPSTLIPIDATRHSPRDRLYPITLKVPLGELDLLGLHAEVLGRLEAYRHAEGKRESYYNAFADVQVHYLSTLASLGAVLSRAKAIAISDEGTSTNTIRMLAHLPTALQRLLDQIPNRFDILNDIIKGREVFSNIGQVAAGSSLTRFTTAKDDNDKKTLGWGILTDDAGRMHITLRDFRPHVAALYAVGRPDLAQWIAQDYLDAYAEGLNGYVDELYDITVMSRETRPSRPH